MNSLEVVNYRPIEVIEPRQGPDFLERLLDTELPAFLIKNAGATLGESIRTARLGKLLTSKNYIGNIRETVEFSYRTHNKLPDNLSDLTKSPDWYECGVTPFHQDFGKRGVKIALNHTRIGEALYRLHPGRLQYEPIDQWEELDPQMLSVLQNDTVDPKVLDPNGYSTKVEARDLLVFDGSYIHSGQSLVTPRISEAIFYIKQDS